LHEYLDNIIKFTDHDSVQESLTYFEYVKKNMKKRIGFDSLMFEE
jgi:hypothetical protein